MKERNVYFRCNGHHIKKTPTLNNCQFYVTITIMIGTEVTNYVYATNYKKQAFSLYDKWMYGDYPAVYAGRVTNWYGKVLRNFDMYKQVVNSIFGLPNY